MDKEIFVEELQNENPINELGFSELDKKFKPNVVHLEIMKMAKNSDGVYNRKDSVRKILVSDNDLKLKKQMISWNKTNIETLIKAGYLKKTDDKDIYIANPIALSIRRKEFKPGINHKKLLEQDNEGIISLAQINKNIKGKDEKAIKRQEGFNKKMIKNLHENGYLERVDRGKYEITDKGYDFLEEMKMNPAQRKANSGFKFTAFDKLLCEVIMDGKIDKGLLENHKRKESLIKRIETYMKNGYINEDFSITKECELMLEKALEYSKNEEISLSKLTNEQLNLIKDIRIFLILSKEQILKHIYHNKELMNSDLRYLIKRNVIQKDENAKIYTLGKKGEWLTNEYYRGKGAVRYTPKVYGKRLEVEHDLLVYSAYTHAEAMILSEGGKILELKNDRQLRKEIAKEYGYMNQEIPDLRILYTKNGKDILVYDIEADIKYKDGEIVKKATGIVNNNVNMTAINLKNNIKGKTDVGISRSASWQGLNWYCKTQGQALKAAKIISSREKTNKIRTRKINIYYMDENGEFRKI